ncbi:MAG TPA: hypothetical protein VLH60_06035, partial [Sedimentisphaerales bacterium]|nr:hypothetical protein [Sedimentisphaerales bacterium]
MSTVFVTNFLKYVKRSWLAAAIIAAMLAVPSSASEVTEPAAATVQSEQALAGDILSVTFQKDTSIREALRYLAAKYQKNIIPSSRVDGILTISTLFDVTFDEAMRAILGNNFVYERDGNFINVYSVEEFRRM